jgi:Mor family transcriptional regulator
MIYKERMEGMKLEWLASTYGLPVSTVHKVIKRMQSNGQIKLSA